MSKDHFLDVDVLWRRQPNVLLKNNFIIHKRIVLN